MMKKIKQTKAGNLVNLHSKPATELEIESINHQLRVVHRNYMNYIFALFVLACGVTYRVISLDFDTGVYLFEISTNIGLWLGMFTGFMATGDKRNRIKICLVSVIVSASCSVFAAMMVVLFMGYMDSWIMSINILASALGSMWVLTYYDEVNQACDALKYVNDKQLQFFKKAAKHFDELDSFHQKICDQGRRPLIGEYWAVLEWIHNKANSAKH